MTSNNPPSKSSMSRGDHSDVSTYDSGYEHSLEHLIELQRRLAQADQEAVLPSIAAKAS